MSTIPVGDPTNALELTAAHTQSNCIDTNKTH